MKLSYLWLFLGLFFGIEVYRSYMLQKAMAKSETVTKYQKGNITYLVFGDGSAITNYTSDSLEYEFLHPSTKDLMDSQVLIRLGDTTYMWVSREDLKTQICKLSPPKFKFNEPDSIILDHSELKKVR
jgi:hypothetical protein